MRYAQTVPPHQIPTRQSCNPGRGGCHNKRSEKNPPRALPSAHQGCYIGRDRRSQHHRESETMPSTRRRQNAASTCAHSRSHHTRTKGATQPQKHRATLPDGSMYAHCSTREVEPTSTTVIPYATSATPPLIKQHYNTNIARERGCHHNPTAQNGHDLRRALHATPKTMVAPQATPTQKAALARLDTHGAPRHLAITLARAATSYTNGTKRGHYASPD